MFKKLLRKFYEWIVPDSALTAGFITGAIWGASVWHRALSSDEMLALYNEGSGVSYPFD